MVTPTKKLLNIEKAYETLNKISPRPIGKYEFPVNKPIDENIDLSIIIPIYNVEKYIEECLLSVINSDTSINYEIICINDGSPDNSFEIVKKLKNMFPTKNIKLISQNNSGLSGARNRGIDEAVGKYIMFIDSDDKIDSSMIDILMKCALENDYDIVSCGMCTFDDHGIKKIYSQKHFYFWGKVIKRSIFNNVRLPMGYWFEDMIVGFIINKISKSDAHIEKVMYYYRINNEGITKTATRNVKSIDQFYMTLYIYDEYIRLNFEFDKEFYKNMMCELSLFLFNRTRNLQNDVKHLLFECVCDFVNSWDLDARDYNGIYKDFLKSCKTKNFRMYINICRNWH